MKQKKKKKKQRNASVSEVAGLQELERTLFLFTALAGMVGEWGAELPRSPTNARYGAANLLTWIAAPSAHPGFRISCPPVSLDEQVIQPKP